MKVVTMISLQYMFCKFLSEFVSEEELDVFREEGERSLGVNFVKENSEGRRFYKFSYSLYIFDLIFVLQFRIEI